jgi:hypothetical protein
MDTGRGTTGIETLGFLFLLLFVVNLVSANYVLSWYPSLFHLPFMWAFLSVMEFVVSPIYDILVGNYPIQDQNFVDAMQGAVLVSILFTAGMFLGIARARAVRSHLGPYPMELDTYRCRAGALAGTVIVVFTAVSLVCQIYVVGRSGALDDVAGARGDGLIGSTLFYPLIRLSDVAAALATWLSASEITKSRRRLFLGLGVIALCSSLPMPLLLQQRFGVIQSLLYFSLPLISRGRLMWSRIAPYFRRFFPIVLFAVFAMNVVTGMARHLALTTGEVVMSDLLDVDLLSESQETHFRHMRLLAELKAKGLDRAHFGGVSNASMPLAGDLTIIIPRAWFPDKMLTTMEVINAVRLEHEYTALDRGSTSVDTAGITMQLYIFGGAAGILPLAFLFSYISLRTWDWAASRSDRPAFLVMALIVWFQCGWLALNVVLTSLELPGMLLAMAVVGLARVAVPVPDSAVGAA